MTAPLSPSRGGQDDLERMSDAELADLEDRLLLQEELDLSPRAQLTAGRVVVWVLTIVGIVVSLSLIPDFPPGTWARLTFPCISSPCSPVPPRRTCSGRSRVASSAPGCAGCWAAGRCSCTSAAPCTG